MPQLTDAEIMQAASTSPLRFLPPDARVQRKGLNRWMAQCPFHNDRTPSMSITECDDGRYRWKCHGCDEAGDTITLVQKTRDMSFVDAVRTVINAAKAAPMKPEIEATYDYADEQGELLYQVVRYRPKDFRVRTPLPNGEWCWRRPPRLVLYRLPDILATTDTIFVVEGEKDADTIVRAGGQATTWPFGATAWRGEYAKSLAGKSVVVVPDRDEAGMAAGRLVYESVRPWCERIGHVLIDPEYKDVSELFGSHGDDMQLLFDAISWLE